MTTPPRHLARTGGVVLWSVAASLAAALAGGTAGCGRTVPPDAPQTPAIALVTPPRAPHAVLDLTGLGRDERGALTTQPPDTLAWEALLRVTVEVTNPQATPPPPVAGRYSVTDQGVRFTPAFPLQPGRRYHVHVDLGRVRREGPRTLDTTIGLPGSPAPAAQARVVGISPAADTLPENLLRLYVWFSAPMARESGLPHITLIDERTGEVKDAFLPVDGGFWNHDFTRYTLFFDPGRVKAGIGIHEQMGRPLVAGHRYRLVIAPTWRDAHGAPLVEGFEHRFRAVEAETRPLDIGTWAITPPAAGTRDPLVVHFPAPLDHALALRTIGVERAPGTPLDGDVSIDAVDTEWRFVPRDPWPVGRYTLVALDALEDPAGNRLGRAFEVPVTDAAVARDPHPPRVTRGIEIAR